MRCTAHAEETETDRKVLLDRQAPPRQSAPCDIIRFLRSTLVATYITCNPCKFRLSCEPRVPRRQAALDRIVLAAALCSKVTASCDPYESIFRRQHACNGMFILHPHALQCLAPSFIYGCSAGAEGLSCRLWPHLWDLKASQSQGK